MRKWNLVIDAARCNSCNNCVIVTKDEYDGNEFEGYSKPSPGLGVNFLQLQRHERGTGHHIDVTHYPTTCNHCDNAPCINDTTRGAIYQRPDGIVIIDPVKATGRKDIVGACPYGQIFWNEALQLPQKWTFDAHLIDRGDAPKCVQACPTGAIEALKVEDSVMAGLTAEQNLRVLRPELGARPRVHYRNLERVGSHYIAGTVISGGECAADLSVELWCQGKLVQQTTTDWLGDFKFDLLELKEGPFEVRIIGEDGGAVSSRTYAGDTSGGVGEILV